jgi:hypothetical protein
MLKGAILALCAVASAACTTESVLSKSIYDHQVRAYELRTQGDVAAADAELAAAHKDRNKLARISYGASREYSGL